MKFTRSIRYAVTLVIIVVVYGLAGTSDYNDKVAYDEFKNEMIERDIWLK